MRVVIAGGHGQIALALTRLLAGRGDEVRGLIRNPDHEADLRAAGAEPVLCDLEALDEDEVAKLVGAADALVFAAGAGPGSGGPRKLTMDRDGALKTIAACAANGIDRYIMVSAMGAASPPAGDDVFLLYLRAKAEADVALARSGLAFTIVRPGRLTGDPASGRVRAAESVPRGDVAREDVAAVIAACLDEPGTAGVTFELVGGDEPVPAAVAALAQRSA